MKPVRARRGGSVPTTGGTPRRLAIAPVRLSSRFRTGTGDGSLVARELWSSWSRRVRSSRSGRAPESLGSRPVGGLVPVPVCPRVLARGGNQRPAHAAHEAEVVAGVVNAHGVRLEGVYFFVGHRPTIDPAGRRGHCARPVNPNDE